MPQHFLARAILVLDATAPEIWFEVFERSGII